MRRLVAALGLGTLVFVGTLARGSGEEADALALRPCSPATAPGAACRWEPAYVVDVRADDDPGTPRLAAVVLEGTHTKERIVAIETDVLFSTGPGRWRCGDPARRWRGLLTWEACDGREGR